jgi:SDR family mycofactocin-dependent oxidoreductase
VTRRVEGKVAFITGAGRGQGRSHALRLAGEGADIVAVDYCTDIGTISYPMSTKDDLAETARLVEDLDRRVTTIQADVRDLSALGAAVQTAIAEYGKIDIVCPNAGISADGPDQSPRAFADVVGVDLVGVLNTVNAVLPELKEGASIIVTGSVAAMMMGGVGTAAGGVGYTFSKRTLIDFVRQLAVVLAPMSIRINGIHPTNCNTMMLQHEDMYRVFRPDLEHPTREDAIPAFTTLQSMPVPWVEPADVSNAVLFLASDEARYVTGQFLAVDAGALLKIPASAH